MPKTTDPPSRIPARGGREEDVFSGWRRVLCYTKRPHVCQRAKRSYSRRLRKLARILLKKHSAL
jgi:hypothetical protein